MNDMSWTPNGKHLFAGEWVGGDTTVSSTPATVVDFMVHGGAAIIQ
jgi:hypothetical protein